ncbi:hypothetical protein Cni_G07639 [Canna indica]|uniref:PRA1 family protein n=1 Tax=Canna indica TaxID=4628 RepID=A0AAQ3K1K1_9LILI|nr:hypothetical protein Cni_G07639 [Canna indica]
MTTYGAVVRRSAAVVERARSQARSARRAIARFARPQSFAPPADAEAAAVRAVRNVASFRLHYAALLWFLLIASLFPRRRATMLFLMAFSKAALFYGALLKAFPASALLRRLVDGQIVTALAIVVILVEIVMTKAVPELLLAMGIGLPVVLLHAVFRVRDNLAENGDDKAMAAVGGVIDELDLPLEKKEDLELGTEKSAE